MIYGSDLAAIHDEGYSEPAELGARRLVAELAARGVESGLVVDLGCGGGVSSRVIAEAGYEVLGIDPSIEMLELARERVPAARFEVGFAASAQLPRCVGAGGFGEALNYVVSADPSDPAAAVGPVFARIAAALEPGGSFLFDLAAASGGEPRTFETEGDGWTMRSEVSEDGDLLTRRIITRKLEDGLWCETEEIHLQRLHEPAEVLAALHSAGFGAEETEDWDERDRPGHHAYAAVRHGPD